MTQLSLFKEWKRDEKVGLQMKEYIHKVQYYETDQMQIAHHSNYIRWMEEARVAFLESIGWGYDRLEQEGVVSPVTAIDCKYRATSLFAEEIAIQVTLKECKGVRLILDYTMTKVKDGTHVFTGTSEHCFINEKKKPIRIDREFPEFYEKLQEMM